MVMPRSRSISIESSTCSSIRAGQPPQKWDESVGQGRFAVVDVGNDGSFWMCFI